MKFLRIFVKNRGAVLAVLRDGEVLAVKRRDGGALRDVIEYLRILLDAGGSIEEIDDELLEKVADYAEIEHRPPGSEIHMLVPIEAPEVWGCGVTYERSRSAREVETSVKGI